MVKVILLSLLLLFSLTAGDNDMLQDVCVADLSSSIKVNGYPCKPGTEISAEDFSFTGIAKGEGQQNYPNGASAIQVTVEKLPGLNTLGMSMNHVELAPRATVPLHAHPRASELIFVIQGQVDAGFITTSNKHFTKSLSEKHMFVFPKGLKHYVINRGDSRATVLAALNSQSPGATDVAPALFAADPPLPDDVLTDNFLLTTSEVQKIKHRLPLFRLARLS